MPEMDGYAFTRALRERDTAARSRSWRCRRSPQPATERSGFDAYLAKPIDPFHLVDEIARIALPATA